MTKITNEQIAEKFGVNYAKDRFQLMLDVSNQGPAFTWEKFPKMFYEACKKAFYINSKTTSKNMLQLQDIAADSYMKHVKVLISEAKNKGSLPIKT